MKRRGFLGAIAGVFGSLFCLKPSSASTTTTTWECDPDTENVIGAEHLGRDRGVYVGDEAGQKLWFWRYKTPKGPWIGWLDDANGKCWGFVDQNSAIWQLGKAGCTAENAPLGCRRDLLIGYFDRPFRHLWIIR